MNALRKVRVLALVALLVVVVFGIGTASAEAGGKCHYGGYGGYSSSYCYTPTYYKSCYYPSYDYCNYDYSCYYPKFCSYPVTTYDCFGRPYTVWQSGYGVAPVSYLP